MRLNDSSGDGAVELFTRFLRLQVPVYSAIGGLASDDDDDEASTNLLVIIHEMEHLRVLARPLGWMLTLLAVRALDERNACASLLNEAVNSDNEANWARAHGAELTDRISNWYRWSISTQYLARAVLPLLEGLALYTEGFVWVPEVDGSPPGFGIAVSLACQNQNYLAPAPRDEAALYIAVYRRLLSRLMSERERRTRQGDDSTNRLFFGPKSLGKGKETGPYFFGYLYVVRLLERWRAATAGRISEAQLMLAVNCFVGELVPADLPWVIPEFVKTGDAYGYDLFQLFSAYLNAALEFGADDIELLVSGQRGVLNWSGSKPAITDLGISNDAHFMSVAARTFEMIFNADVASGSVERPSTGGMTSQETLFDLLKVEHAKHLHLAAEVRVQMLGYDKTHGALLLALPSGQLHNLGVDLGAMNRFLVQLETDDLPAVDVNAGADQPTGCVPALLQIWLETWPDGYHASDVESLLRLAKLRQLLIAPDALIALADRDTPDECTKLIQIRSRSLRLIDDAARVALTWEDFLQLAGIANDVFILADDHHSVLTGFWKELQEPTPRIISDIDTIYADILFPACKRHAEVAEHKLDLVLDALGADEEAAIVLWKFLQRAVWGLPTPAAVEPDASSIDRIRAVCLTILGIPLVGRDGHDFDLEPPAPARA